MVAEVGWPDVLDTLLKRGAIVDAAPSGKRAEENKIAGSTPLIGATKYNHPECVKRLLDYEANPNHQNQSGISALMLAAEQGFFECVKLLVQAGANLELAPSGMYIIFQIFELVSEKFWKRKSSTERSKLRQNILIIAQ